MINSFILMTKWSLVWIMYGTLQADKQTGDIKFVFIEKAVTKGRNCSYWEVASWKQGYRGVLKSPKKS